MRKANGSWLRLTYAFSILIFFLSVMLGILLSIHFRVNIADNSISSSCFSSPNKLVDHEGRELLKVHVHFLPINLKLVFLWHTIRISWILFANQSRRDELFLPWLHDYESWDLKLRPDYLIFGFFPVAVVFGFKNSSRKGCLGFCQGERIGCGGDQPRHSDGPCVSSQN